MSVHNPDKLAKSVNSTATNTSTSANSPGSNDIRSNKVKPRLISIMGPTATGKTSLALWLAQQIQAQTTPGKSKKQTQPPEPTQRFNAPTPQPTPQGVALISADSKQVFRGLETITGADVPANFKRIKAQDSQLKYDYFLHQQQATTLHGVSILMPDEEWSVTQFRNLAIHVIQAAWKKNYLPIVVGGTGFYHQQLFNNDPQLYIPPQNKIRQQAEQKTVEQLQAWLQDLAADKLAAMNRSDRHNPRRLIRAIEVAQALQEPGPQLKQRLTQRPHFSKPDQYLALGLKASSKTLKNKIKQRVLRRFTSGAVQEVKNLIALNLPAHSQALAATGVEPITRYLEQEQTAQQTLAAWTQQEYQYAQRQLTWWKQAGSRRKEGAGEREGIMERGGNEGGREGKKKNSALSQNQTTPPATRWFNLDTKTMSKIKQDVLDLVSKLYQV